MSPIQKELSLEPSSGPAARPYEESKSNEQQRIKMQVNFSSELLANLNSAFLKMQKENLDSYLEPISSFTIYRKSSKMAQELLNQDFADNLAIPIHMEGEDWILTL